MIIVKATNKDVDEIIPIIDEAKEWLKSQNVDQWQDGYPNREVFLNDVSLDRLFVVKQEKQVVGCFVVVDYEKTYDEIYEGAWLTNDPYIAVHRIAVKNSFKGQGVAKFIFDELKKNNKHIRVDTHQGNKNMRKCLEKNDFKYCGVIYLERGAENDPKRLAYEYLHE